MSRMEAEIMMTIDEPWLALLHSGSLKTIMKLADPMNWGNLVVGQKVALVNSDRTKKKVFVVKDLRQYENFVECMVSEGVRNLLPGKKTMKDALEVYFGGRSGKEFRDKRAEYDFHGCVCFDVQEFIPPMSNSEMRSLVNRHLGKALEKSKEKQAKCSHKRPDGSMAIEHNDDPMGGSASTWNERCYLCGFIFD